jgi:hypothetical protein
MTQAKDERELQSGRAGLGFAESKLPPAAGSRTVAPNCPDSLAPIKPEQYVVGGNFLKAQPKSSVEAPQRSSWF